MQVNKIFSIRKYQSQFFRQIVFEWEDDIAKQMNIPIKGTNKIMYTSGRIIDKYLPGKSARYFHQKAVNALVFILFPPEYKYFFPANVVPIFLDTWGNTFQDIVNYIKNIDAAIFTNYQMYLKICEACPEKKIRYVPLGIARKWIDKLAEETHDKVHREIDVIQVGRRNEALHEYMMKYYHAHPDIDYVYRDSWDSQEYVSTLRGNIGSFRGREQYMRALRRSKVSLVSSPGVDDLNKVGGVDFFTPRFYESLAMGCQTIGRYTAGAEAELLKVSQVVPNVHTYEEFHAALQKALNTEPNITNYLEFLQKNSLANQIAQLDIWGNLQTNM